MKLNFFKRKIQFLNSGILLYATENGSNVIGHNFAKNLVVKNSQPYNLSMLPLMQSLYDAWPSLVSN